MIRKDPTLEPKNAIENEHKTTEQRHIPIKEISVSLTAGKESDL